MNKKVNALVKESSGGHTIHANIISPDAVAGRSELGQRIIGRQADGPNDGDVGLELGPGELGSKTVHQLLQPGAHLVRWDRPHRINFLPDLFLVGNRRFFWGWWGCHEDEEEREAQESEKGKGFNKEKVVEHKHSCKLREKVGEKSPFLFVAFFFPLRFIDLE